ncbi:hypothetical protein [Kutzneria sp. NPDC052558]|uniref:hypothetical protein n=1 Tax=Kutzneria sp. NPDC052558 TaxID=3364121 RepID=UPI0037C5DCC4
MANTPAQHRPNVLFNLIGVLLIVGGVALTVYGLLSAFQVIRGFDAFRDDAPPFRVADYTAAAFWGIIVLTIGRYFWRGARRRGARDRFGRLLIICGYLLLGVALDRGVHAAVRLWSARSEAAIQSAGLNTLAVVALWGIPASVLAIIGFRLANEKALAKAEINVET